MARAVLPDPVIAPMRFSSEYLRAGPRHIHCTRLLSRSRAFVMLCNPLWNERNYASPLYHTLMRSLAATGFDVVLFDWTGQGNSGGESWEMSIETMRSDIDTVKAAFLPRADCPVAMVSIRTSSLLAGLIPGATEVLIDPIVDAGKWFRSLLVLERTKEIVAFRKSALSAVAFSVPAQGDRITLCETVIGARLYNDLIECSRDFRVPKNAVEIGLACNAPLAASGGWIDLRVHNPYREGIWQTPGKFTQSICSAVSEGILSALIARGA